ncbi:hypothetical protein PPEP_a3655 [Pseudoalteromonas peptidolytica F12-50-A1]|uniref:Uncharacterized protein n=1 Tax=Pseudoalteromonas peptidolytica F12-50-A1 TaxID=1315280 RepID=A0A8I0MVU7_9GAMM|nr:hypothetical protein [Pseudoalteromonas peptidolytica F12-50-A1]
MCFHFVFKTGKKKGLVWLLPSLNIAKTLFKIIININKGKFDVC